MFCFFLSFYSRTVWHIAKLIFIIYRYKSMYVFMGFLGKNKNRIWFVIIPMMQVFSFYKKPHVL